MLKGSQKKLPRRVNQKARQIVTIAREKGYSYDEIADICDVSVGSVKRWLATGRADASKIQHLENMIGPIYLSPESVSNTLVEIYQNRRKRYRLDRYQLKSIAGRSALKASFIEKITEEILDRGYYFLEGFGNNDEDDFIIIKITQLNRYVPTKLSRDEIQEHFLALSEEIVEEEE